MSADGRKPPGGDEAIDVEDLFSDLFADAPPTDPTVPALIDPGADPGPHPSDDETGGEEITLEVPAASAAARAQASVGIELEPPVAFAPLLPEMDAEIWQAGIQALVSVPEALEPAPELSPDAWVDEALFFRDESALADSPARAAALLAASARACELAGRPVEAAARYDEALAQSPSAPDVLRARARLAESAGDFDEAQALWARLALVAELPDERAFYAALSAEWTLGRRGALPAVALDALAAGPARVLALAEEALRGGSPGGTAAAFAAAGRALGGAAGAAFLDQAARLAVVARDGTSAAAYRMAARRLDPETPESLIGRLRAVAATDARTAAPRLAEIAASLPAGSMLAEAVLRWGAGLARRRGDLVTAASFLAGAGTRTVAAARDRIDLDATSGAPLDGSALERLRAAASSPAAAANLAWIEAGERLRQRDPSGALARIAAAIEVQADAVPLGLWAEEIARATSDPALRAAALELWLRADPARRAAAGLELAAARDAVGSALGARAALQTAVESAPEAASFWAAAAADARAGRRGDAARALEFGAEVWGASTLAPALRAVAAVKQAPGDPGRALAALGVASADGGLGDTARALGLESVARLAERAGDRAALAAALEASAAETVDPTQRAWLALRRASPIGAEDGPARVRLVAAALGFAPAHPLALALALADPDADPVSAAEVLARAGGAADAPGFGRLAALVSVSLLALTGDRPRALARAAEVLASLPGDRLARGALVRAARLAGDAGVAALAALPVDPAAADDAQTLAIAEARIDWSDWDGALEALRTIEAGPLGAEARRVEARAAVPGADALPHDRLFGPADDAAAAARAALASLLADAAAGRWEKLSAVLAGAPPHELRAGPETLAIAALIAEGHDVEASVRLAEEAVRATPDGASGRGAPFLTLARVAEAAGDAALRLRALDLSLSSLGAAETDRRAAAALRAVGARIQAEAGELAAATESWRAALALEPTFLPAARALRLDAARRGDAVAAAAACQIEAACLLVPEHRVRLFLLAAGISLESTPPEPERALGFLRAALAIDPAHEAAFERLRALLAARGDLPALAAALAARLEVAQNPFEITSLRLARAELLLGPLADPDGARAELDAVLRRQPEHPRALERLSELLVAREAWAEAGEVFLQRAVVERDPTTLRAIFLRLGDIYSTRVPDAKRAAAAYERVLTVDADNVEALRALSDVCVAEGDARRALPVTDRLVAIEPDPPRRQSLRIRLGEVLMQVGDLRRAGAELRRAVEEAPRDIGAIRVLAQLLDRARDPAGRRAMLDRAAGLLRHDLGRPDGLHLATLRALAQVLELRDRPHAALAAAQLVVALGAGAREGARAGSRPPRSLAGLRRPELDERAFSAEVLPGVRQLMRLAGPLLRPSGQELAQRLARQGVGRPDRRTRGTRPRPVFDAVAGELGAGDFDLYVTATAAPAGPAALRVEPGSPPAVIIGSVIEALGPAAVRFAAGRTMRLVSTQLDAILAVAPEEAGALLVGIIRQSVADYQHPEVREVLAAAETTRVERLIPRKLKQQLLPFAVESAGPFDLPGLHAAVRDGANAAGLLAAADLPAALSVVLASAGAAASSGSGLTLAAVAANPEARTLLRFAVSDDYDDLARALESD